MEARSFGKWHPAVEKNGSDQSLNSLSRNVPPGLNRVVKSVRSFQGGIGSGRRTDQFQNARVRGRWGLGNWCPELTNLSRTVIPAGPLIMSRIGRPRPRPERLPVPSRDDGSCNCNQFDLRR